MSQALNVLSGNRPWLYISYNLSLMVQGKGRKKLSSGDVYRADTVIWQALRGPVKHLKCHGKDSNTWQESNFLDLILHSSWYLLYLSTILLFKVLNDSKMALCQVQEHSRYLDIVQKPWQRGGWGISPYLRLYLILHHHNQCVKSTALQVHQVFMRQFQTQFQTFYE